MIEYNIYMVSVFLLTVNHEAISRFHDNSDQICQLNALQVHQPLRATHLETTRSRRNVILVAETAVSLKIKSME